MDANEVLKRYADGQRNFRSQDLKGLNLIKANLKGVDFVGANLSGSDLPDGKMHNDYLESANYLGV